MAAPPACCASRKPLEHAYATQGRLEQLGDLPVYASGRPGSQLGLVMIPDIFGFEFHQSFQVADRFASEGFRVILIDCFRGKPWPYAEMPFKPEDDFPGWLARNGSWERLRPDVHVAAARLQAEGATKLGCVGFCWGVSIALTAGQDPSLFSVVGGAHPTLFGRELEFAEKVQVPVVLLPSGEDASTDPIKAVLDKRPYGKLCVYQRFDDQVHGFMAARGDFKDPRVAAAAGRGVELIAEAIKAA
ncbi:hypothetical protein HYH03_000112 [Edaphochlamys debaryana]|uniref:Dienelactone hydrolase domain-containing protein n=1 Tax=Edaphochlamys debaryana TaxID=47281 RepID=A0A835YGY3_9CHLO|nr:hypothetical protein HYH03_000112 [Edaphochlamys debaryana]|eukprot:KAG2501607.1 hypothetical protein HYH03_000112 [Edaphochlamys debaryana]